MDVEYIRPGQDFAQAIDRTIAAATVVLVIIGPRWMEILRSRSGEPEPDYVRHEIEAAIKRKSTIIPVLDGSGKPVLDPATGLPKTIGKPKNQNLADRRRARRTHLEDWIAAIVFNHLFSGADAWVAANLADFDSNVNVSAAGRGIQIAARVAW